MARTILETVDGLERLKRGMGLLIKEQTKMTRAFTETSKGLKEQGDTAKKTVKEYRNLKEITDVITNANKSFGNSFQKLTQDSKGWTAMSRMLSGTLAWKLQNYVRAIGDGMQAWTNATEKNNERLRESAETSIALHGAYADIAGQLTEINEALVDADKFDTLAEKMDGLEPRYQRYLARLGDEAEARKLALKETKALFEYQERKVTKLIDKEQKRMDIQQEMAKMTSIWRGGPKLARTRMAMKALGEKRAEYKTSKGRYKAVQERAGIISGLEERIGGMTEGAEGRGKLGKKLGGFRTQQNKAMKQLGDFLPFSTKILNFFKVAFSRAALYFLPIVIGLFVVFALIRKIMENGEMMQAIIDFIGGIIENLMFILEGVFDIFGAFFGEGTLSDRFKLLLTGLVKIFGGIFGILLEVGTVVIKLAIGLFVGIITGIIDMWIAVITALFNWKEVSAKIVPALKKIFWTDTLKPHFAKWWERATNWFTGLIERITGTIQRVKDAFSIKGLGGALNPLGFAAGGIHTAGGMALVGERGPELVNMPAGTRIHSNKDSKRMLGNTNNITVNVQGRMGATDAELRDMAQKFGRMISREVSRTVSSKLSLF